VFSHSSAFTETEREEQLLSVLQAHMPNAAWDWTEMWHMPVCDTSGLKHRDSEKSQKVQNQTLMP
jgi:hypothetical protein